MWYVDILVDITQQHDFHVEDPKGASSRCYYGADIHLKKSKDRMDIKINRPLNEELTFSMLNKKEKHLRCGPQGQNNMVVGGVNECK